MTKRTGNYCRVFLHFVWSTKNWEPVNDDEIRGDVVKNFHAKAIEMGIHILEANGPSDHMHVLLKSITTLSPSDTAKALKGASSHFVNHETLKNDEIRRLYWQDGYGVSSVSPRAVASVAKYIRLQQEHHRMNSVLADYEL